MSFQPHVQVLPQAQQRLWPELAKLPKHFVLYGGTALALRLGHRSSVDFDFFTSEPFVSEDLLGSIEVLQGGKILQNVSQTLTLSVNRGAEVKLSFFGGLRLGRVGEPEMTADSVLRVASLLDLAGMKAAVVTQRAESKDYLDLLALFLELSVAGSTANPPSDSWQTSWCQISPKAPFHLRRIVD